MFEHVDAATNPLNNAEEWEEIQRFCSEVNKELEGPQYATRLLSHKIQSPQEWEAMQGLTVLEVCMRNCGARFHAEVGKYRFLNELIKVLSPKYLGARSTAKVKNKIVELMYSWTVGIANETKIQDAYKMLKRQGVIQQDPKLPDDNQGYFLPPPPPPRPSNPLFEDEEKSKLLSRLLKSGHPDDLDAANRLIKTMVKEDQTRMEKITKRIGALKSVEECTHTLSEMVARHRHVKATTEEFDSMKEVYKKCERLRPTLFKLASDTDDNDDALADILRANDGLTSVMEFYKSTVEGQTINGDVQQSVSGRPCGFSTRRGNLFEYPFADFPQLEDLGLACWVVWAQTSECVLICPLSSKTFYSPESRLVAWQSWNKLVATCCKNLSPLVPRPSRGKPSSSRGVSLDTMEHRCALMSCL
uniref:ADP-ribosylation factor-binding protein GGA1 n=1 Tax=Eptatretus burgeri TaxID=7764 RepID=A0A8C4NIL6_EPTBU